MRGTTLSALTFTATLLTAASARADYTRPYHEYEVRIENQPSRYLTDVNEASELIMARDCDAYGHTGCQLVDTSYFNSMYMANYTHKTPNGPAKGSAWGYRYFACNNPPSLYIVRGDQSWGPYANHTWSVGALWGEPLCYSAAPPVEPIPTLPRHQADLGPGQCLTHPTVGNPISAGIQNKYEEITDIAATMASSLMWVRHYNSGAVAEGDDIAPALPATTHLGSRWRGTYDRSLHRIDIEQQGTRYQAIRLFRHTGEQIDYIESKGHYESTVDPRGKLTVEGDGWQYRTHAGDTEHYDAHGRLVSLDEGGASHMTFRYADTTANALLTEAVDRQGRSLRFDYDAALRLATVRDSEGHAVSYAYAETDGAGLDADLVKVTYADASSVSYLYNEKERTSGIHRPHALTGIVDENGVRYASFMYGPAGNASVTEHARGTHRYDVVPGGGGKVYVDTPTLGRYTYQYADVFGGRRVIGVNQPGGAGCGPAMRSLDYDDRGNLSRMVDFDGKVTRLDHDADGNETERVEAAGTPLARTTRTAWHPSLLRPTRVTRQGREERLTYDARGNITRYEQWGAIDPNDPTSSLVLSRAWTTTYDNDGRRLQENGPRSDMATIGLLRQYIYRPADDPHCASGTTCDYRKGDLWKIENALGHTEEILRYDGAGRVIARRTMQGLLIEHQYDARGRVTEIRETQPEGKVSATTIDYTPHGDVASVKDADGVTLRFGYDEAHRLITVHNPSNHWLRFQYDQADQLIREESYDGLNMLRTQLLSTYDTLGRLASEEDGEGRKTTFAYDAMGRTTSTTDAAQHRHASSYDALGRLHERIGDIDGLNAKIRSNYDPLDQLTSIQDPKGLSTNYLVTGLGNLSQVASPDTGESFDEHDATGGVIRHEAAAGIGSYRVTRDALGRPLHIAYTDAATDIRYIYDIADTACPAAERHETGMLTTMTTAQGRTIYCHDAHGRITRKIQRWNGTETSVAYRYTAAGRLASVDIQGGTRSDYRYDKDGAIAAIDVTPEGGVTTSLIARVTYRPFDVVNGWEYGDGRSHTITRDRSGRVTSWGDFSPQGMAYAVSYTPGGDIDSLVGRYFTPYRFAYDGLGHLTRSKDYNNEATDYLRFDYDLTGNRTAVTESATRDTYLYQPDSHRLITANGQQRRYDATGNTVAIGNTTLTYDTAGRLASASEHGRLLVSYGYDGDHQRIARTEASGNATTIYLLSPDGRWLADVDTNGRVHKQGLWMGDLLVGLIVDGKPYYVEPDHLGTPRVVIDPVRNVDVWRWSYGNDPFGTNAPDEDPDGDGQRFVFDLRFPGQRYDASTGLHANGARDYDPETGRYVQSDPIGLAGDISTYLYANGSPLRYIDPSGLVRWEGRMEARGIATWIGVGFYKFHLESECINGQKAKVLVEAAGASIGASIKYAPPVSSTGSSIVLNDRLDRINPNVMDGWFSIWSAGASLGHGYSASMVQIGGNGRVMTKPANSGAWAAPSYGAENGIELGAGGTAGRSKVRSTMWCGCSEQAQ